MVHILRKLLAFGTDLRFEFSSTAGPPDTPRQGSCRLRRPRPRGGRLLSSATDLEIDLRAGELDRPLVRRPPTANQPARHVSEQLDTATRGTVVVPS